MYSLTAASAAYASPLAFNRQGKKVIPPVPEALRDPVKRLARMERGVKTADNAFLDACTPFTLGCWAVGICQGLQHLHPNNALFSSLEGSFDTVRFLFALRLARELVRGDFPTSASVQAVKAFKASLQQQAGGQARHLQAWLQAARQEENAKRHAKKP